MKCFGITDKGRIREDNQDCFIIERCEKKDCLIVALCDGMGGAKAGGLASRLANKTFVSFVFDKLMSRKRGKFPYKKILIDACAEANRVDFDYSQFDDSCKGMGTTIVGGIISENGNGSIINVGDSRAYLLSPRRMKITQITRDHSLVEDLVEYGAITKEQAKTHPQRNVITRAVGSEEEVDADYYEFKLQSSDILLLCSDGLTNTISDPEILECAVANSDPELLCRTLMEKALDRGASDNVTIVAVTR
ncbi:MAG: Stp1/IreP family PP2C-type Ser/Thr phosphatase [Oscillospiraceae bacterium]|nr:Stp1/IreP family PP2C-type Ser/Thr phosphatase [Oscillospiraceae bacterium]